MPETVCVITGGAGGMGLATAKITGQVDHLVLSDVGQERLDAAVTELAALGITADTFVCDVTDRRAVDALLDFAASKGNLVSVVHTAGVSPQMGDQDLILRINALGTINVTESFLARAKDGDRLVNVSSMAAHTPTPPIRPKRAYKLAFSDPERMLAKMSSRCRKTPEKGRPGLAYMISKHFVKWYSSAIAPRFGERGARVVSVSPGSFDTAMGQLEADHGAAAMLQFAALKRFGRPEEIAEVLAFCASEKASYLTATDILCDGGVSANLTFRKLMKMGRH